MINSLMYPVRVHRPGIDPIRRGQAFYQIPSSTFHDGLTTEERFYVARDGIQIRLGQVDINSGRMMIALDSHPGNHRARAVHGDQSAISILRTQTRSILPSGSLPSLPSDVESNLTWDVLSPPYLVDVNDFLVSAGILKLHQASDMSRIGTRYADPDGAVYTVISMVGSKFLIESSISAERPDHLLVAEEWFL